MGFRFAYLGRIQKSESRIQERDACLRRAFYLMLVLWARFLTPTVIGVASSSTGGHYTIEEVKSQAFIGRIEDLAAKRGKRRKRDLNHEFTLIDTKFFLTG